MKPSRIREFASSSSLALAADSARAPTCRCLARSRKRASANGAEHALRNTGNGQRAGVRPDFQKKYSYFPSIQKPVIAAVNGPAVGLGFIISLYCDLRFASDAARFGTAFAKRGLIAEYGLAWMLPRLIGPANALDMLFSARLVDAERSPAHGACRTAFFRRITFLEDVQGYAKELAHNVSPRSMRVMKEQVYSAMFQTLAEAFESLRTGNAPEPAMRTISKKESPTSSRSGAAAFTGK